MPSCCCAQFEAGALEGQLAAATAAERAAGGAVSESESLQGAQPTRAVWLRAVDSLRGSSQVHFTDDASELIGFMVRRSEREELSKAVGHYNMRTMRRFWLYLLGYVIAIRTERARKECKLSAFASAHYRLLHTNKQITEHCIAGSNKIYLTGINGRMIEFRFFFQAEAAAIYVAKVESSEEGTAGQGEGRERALSPSAASEKGPPSVADRSAARAQERGPSPARSGPSRR